MATPIPIEGTQTGLALGRVGDRDVVITGHFQTVRVWDAHTSRLIASLPFGAPISAMAIHDDGAGGFDIAVVGSGVALARLSATLR